MMKAAGFSGISGTIDAPPSKSETIRVIAASLLASGTSSILHLSFCEDAVAALDIAATLGAEISVERNDAMIRGNGALRERNFEGHTIRCGESGLCIRMFTPVAALAGEEFVVEASGSLRSRPVRMLEALAALGGTCETTNGYAPVKVRGKIKGGRIDIDGSESSQFLTGLLMSLPLCEGDSTVTVSNLKSRPYIRMTIDCLRRFGVLIFSDEDFETFDIRGNQHYRACLNVIEGDWSGAAFFLVAGAVAGSIRVKGLRMDSHQADKAIIDALGLAGADVTTGEDCISVEKDRLEAFRFNAADCPDLVPPLVALAAHCEGRSVIYGTERLVYKESNRAHALASEFSRLGIEVGLFEDRMEIRGGKIGGKVVDSHNDHRIAMACAIAALNGPAGVVIRNPGCVAKSYPGFFDDLDSVRVA